AFTYFLKQGVGKVICEEKHMGSRAIVIVCRDSDAARKRFGVLEGESGIVYTRTGRPFFSDKKMEIELLSALQQAITSANLWEEQNTDWFCIDCELMPWSAKAQDLIKSQYASVGSAGSASLKEVANTLTKANSRL